MERLQEMLLVSADLSFKQVKAIPIMTASRGLVKKGKMQRLIWFGIETRLKFGLKFHQTVYVFLFTDLLVISKKKRYYCR